MDKQKQIEEMVELMANWAVRNNMLWHEGHAQALAETFAENDYGKIPEGSVVLTKEEFEKLEALKGDYVKGYEAGVDEGWNNAVTETAEKFVEMLKESLDISVEGYSTSEVMSEIEDKIDEICKEITEGKDAKG